jgi:hypothetical protein
LKIIWTMKNMCTFATSKFITEATKVAQALSFRAFFIPENVHDTRRSTPWYSYNGYAKPPYKDLDSGKWTPFFFCPLS